MATVRAVKLSLKSDYAARAVLALARHHPSGKPQRVDDIAAEQGLPPKYLVQILIELKASRIVRSLRGKVGGYMLARPPAEISLGDILRAVHGEVFSASGLDSTNSPPELRAAWMRLQQAVDSAADAITFQQLVEQSQDKAKMYYI